MSLIKEALFPAAPFVERAKRVNFGAHPNGRYILFAKVINAELGTEVGEILGMSRPINAVDFKPTRPFRLATGSEDFLVCFFEGPPFKFKKSVSKHKNFVNCCRFSPKGDIYVTGGADGHIHAFNATDSEYIGEFGSPAHSSGIYGLEFSSSGSRLVSVSTDKTVKLWDTGSGNFGLLSEFAFENKPENQQLGCVWVGDKLVTVSLSGAMQVFNADPDVKELAAPADVIFGHSRPIKCSAYSKSANRLVTASTDMLMLSWDISKGVAKPFSGPEAHKSSIEALTICGDRVISVGVDDRLVVSSLTNHSFDISVKLDSQPRAIASADNQLLVVACYQHVYLFSLVDVNTAPKLLVCSKEEGEPSTCAISRSGELAVVGKLDGSLLFYSTKEGKGLSLIPHVSEKMKGTPTTMAFSPDGKYLAVGDSERHLRLYKVNSLSGGDNSPLVTLVHEWRSHAARVTCVAWNPSSTVLASGSLDCSIMLFKPDSDTRIFDCRNAHPANMITSLVWTSDDTLYSTGQDAFVQAWRFK
ncbi:WD repeat-containing protein 1 [Sparganum proliferum]